MLHEQFAVVLKQQVPKMICCPHCSTNEINAYTSQIQLFRVRTPTVTQMSIFIERIPGVTGAGVSWHCVGTVLMTPTDSLSTFINICEYNAHTSCYCLAKLSV